MNLHYYPRENDKKERWITLLSILLILAVIAMLIFLNWTRIQLSIKGYNKEERAFLLTLDTEELADYLNYDSAIEFSRWDSLENNRHYYNYELLSDTELKDKEIVDYIDTYYENYHEWFVAHGYQPKQIQMLLHRYTIKELAFLKEHTLTWKQIAPYIEINGCIIQDLPQYLQTKKEPQEAIMEISYPNIISQNKTSRIYYLENPEHPVLLIKNGFQVSTDYVPKNLVEVAIPNAPDNTNNKMRKDAAEALENMYQDALKKDLHLAVNSAYRSAKEQKIIYDQMFAIYDSVTASGLVSPPGFSEHQLGLSVDLTSQSVIDEEIPVFGYTKEYEWVSKHAHEYGFILRYPLNKTHITGASNEPWHFRYVGVEVATEIYEKGITLEEYTQQHGFDYPVSLKS